MSPQLRTALCVWPSVEGQDFLVPEDRAKFFIQMERVKKYLTSGKALIGPKKVLHQLTNEAMFF